MKLLVRFYGGYEKRSAIGDAIATLYLLSFCPLSALCGEKPECVSNWLLNAGVFLLFKGSRTSPTSESIETMSHDGWLHRGTVNIVVLKFVWFSFVGHWLCNEDSVVIGDRDLSGPEKTGVSPLFSIWFFEVDGNRHGALWSIPILNAREKALVFTIYGYSFEITVKMVLSDEIYPYVHTENVVICCLKHPKNVR